MRSTRAPNAASADRGRPRSINLSLDERLVEQSRQVEEDLSRGCEEALSARIDEGLGRRWRAENAEAIASSNDFADFNELPLADLRRF